MILRVNVGKTTPKHGHILGLLIMFNPADGAPRILEAISPKVDGGAWGAPMKEMMSVAGSKR